MREEFLAHDQHKLAQDMCHYHSIRDLTLSPRSLININHVFNTKVFTSKTSSHLRESHGLKFFEIVKLDIIILKLYILKIFQHIRLMNFAKIIFLTGQFLI